MTAFVRHSLTFVAIVGVIIASTVTSDWPLWIRQVLGLITLAAIIFDTVVTILLMTIVRRLSRKLGTVAENLDAERKRVAGLEQKVRRLEQKPEPQE